MTTGPRRLHPPEPDPERPDPQELVDEVLQRVRSWGEAPPKPPPKFIDWAEFWEKDHTEAEWAYDDVLAMGRGHSIYAKHGTGKSLFTLWMALEMAINGHVVIYADWEMSEADLHERLSDMGCGPKTNLDRLRYLMIPELAPLNSPQGARQVGEILDAVMLENPDRHVVVVIDTISRAVEGEENSNDTIQGFYRHTGLELKKRAVTWVRLDHAGWEGEHARGASSKGDDVDVVWKLTATEDGIELKADKRRMGWVPEKVQFRQVTDPTLAYIAASGSWPLGTLECATDLDELWVPATAGVRAARDKLKDAGKSRRMQIVAAAQRYRRSVTPHRVTDETSENLPRETPRETPGNTIPF